MKIEPVENGLRVDAFEGADSIRDEKHRRLVSARQEWYRDYLLPAERARGLDDKEDRLFAGQVHAHLEIGQPVTLVLSTDLDVSLDAEQARAAQSNHEWRLFGDWQSNTPH